MVNSARRAFCVLALSSSLVAGATEPDWSHDFSPKVQWYQVTDTGLVMAATNKAVVGIDPASGEMVWERDDLRKVLDLGVSFIPGTPTALVLEAEYKLGKMPKGTLHLLDVTTGEDLWTVEGGPIMWQKTVFRDGGLMYLTQEIPDDGNVPEWTMYYVDMETGEVRWKQVDYFDKNNVILAQWPANPDKKFSVKMTLEGNQDAVLVDDGKAYLELWHKHQGVVKRSLETGEIIWSQPGKYKEKMVPVPRNGKPAMVVAGDAVFVTNNDAELWAYQISDGTPVWDEKKAPKMPGAILSVEPVDDDVLVTGHDGKKAFTALLDGSSGQELWKKPLKFKGMLAWRTITEDGGYVIAETKGTKTLVHHLDVKTGDRRLAKPFKVPGGVGFAEITDGKWFATGSNGNKTYVGMWDLSTGESTWEGGKGYRAKGTVPNLVVDDANVYFVDSRGGFTAVDMSNGSEVYSVDLPLKGKGETPSILLDRGDGQFTTYSSQNVVGLNAADGSVSFHTHYPPPPPTGLQIAAGVTMYAAAAVAAGQSAYAGAQAGAWQAHGNYGQASAWSDESEDWAAAAGAFGAAGSAVMARKKASQASANYYFILTKVKEEDDKGVGLVRVNLATGEEEGSVVIDERDPDYEIDELAGYLYLLRNEKVLEGYRVSEPLYEMEPLAIAVDGEAEEGEDKAAPGDDSDVDKASGDGPVQ